MGGSWKSVPLKSILEPGRGISYGIVQPGAYDPKGIPIIRVSDVRNGLIDTEEPLKVSAAIESQYARTRLRGGELLMSIVGTIGETSVVPEALSGWNVARAIAVIPVSKDVGAYSVRLVLTLPEVRSIIDSRLNTTVQATLNLGDLSELPVLLPPYDIRQSIRKIVGAIDNLVELNRRLGATLEKIGRALFKSWFQDFDPVRAMLEGRNLSLPKAILNLFPSTFSESEKGSLPSGWKICPLAEEFSVTMGQSPPGETYNLLGDGIPFYQGRTDFGFRYPRPRVYCSSPSRFASAGDTLVSVRAPVGDINMATERCCIGRGVAALIHNSRSKSYTYYFAQSIQSDLRQFESDGTVFGAIGKKGLSQLQCIAPSPETVAAFERIVFPFDSLILKNEMELESLSSLRETLLPKLISGELNIGNAIRFSDGVQ